MDKRGEIANRWLRVFEQKTPEAKKIVFERIKDLVTDDVYYLLKELKEKEDDLAQSLSGLSSRFGKLVISDEGVLKYRINGRFVDIKVVVDGLRQLVRLCGMASMENRVKDKVDIELLKDVFKEDL